MTKPIHHLNDADIVKRRVEYYETVLQRSAYELGMKSDWSGRASTDNLRLAWEAQQAAGRQQWLIELNATPRNGGKNSGQFEL